MTTTNALKVARSERERWVSDGGARHAGRLVARIRRNEVLFLFQYFGSDRRRHLFPIGQYDAEGIRGLTLPKARDRASELSSLYRAGVLDIRAHFEEKRAEEERAHKAQEEGERQARDEAKRGALGQLLNAYTAHLEHLGKSSAVDVKNIFKNHVVDANPELVLRKAAEIPVDDFVGLIGSVVGLMASSRDCKTQGALAWKSGVAQSTIGRILRGETSPRTGTLTFLARALRVPLKTFATIADDEKSANKPADSLESVEQFDAVKMTEEVDRALLQALACREDRKRAEQTLDSLRRKEHDAIERLQELVRGKDSGD